MSAFGDIMNGLKTIVELTGKVETLERNVDKATDAIAGLDRRLVRIETIIEVTRADGATLRIARDPE